MYTFEGREFVYHIYLNNDGRQLVVSETFLHGIYTDLIVCFLTKQSWLNDSIYDKKVSTYHACFGFNGWPKLKAQSLKP